MNRSTLRKYLPLMIVAIVTSVVTSLVVVNYVFPDRRGEVANAAALTSFSSSSGEIQPVRADSLPGIADVVERVSGIVVRIDTERLEQQSVLPFLDDGFLGPILGKRMMGGVEVVPGTGSGFIVSADGYVVTNYHVIEKAKKIEVTLTDGRKYPARLVGGDQSSDVAVVKIGAANLPYAQLGNSAALRPGEWVIAIGNPYGFDHTVTAGIVSALGRRLDDNQGNTLATGDLIQTDAAINSGNSGGPLLDLSGRVVGINTAMIPYAQGMGFAISIDSVRDTLSDLIEYGKVNRPWIGLWYQHIDKDLASSLGLSDSDGIIITDVFDGSPAQKAELQRGDVVKEINGNKITADTSIADEISKMKIGDKVRLWVWRDTQKMYITVTLGEYPDGTSDQK